MPDDHAPSPSNLIRLSDIKSRPLKWLWYPYLPAGRLSILFGHPDRGKSIVAITCGTHVSRERPWPDGQPCPHGNVIILEAEDSLEETVKPRFQAADADQTRISTWEDRTLTALPRHIQNFSPSLVIISPLNTYLPKLTNTWNDKNVRDNLQPLADLAEKSGAAILAIMHPPKKYAGLPIYAIGGSVAFGGVPRSVLMVERMPDGLHIMEPIKRNLTNGIPSPIGYRLLPSPADPAIPILQWELVSPTQSLIPPDEDASALAVACEYLQMVLADGPVSSKKVRGGAEQEGIAYRTLMRARKLLNVKAKQIYAGEKSHWELSLPTKEDALWHKIEKS